MFTTPPAPSPRSCLAPAGRYGSLTDKAVTSLSELSARKPTSEPSNATWEGSHIRCFETMLGCRVRYDRYGLKFYRAAQYVVE